MIHLCPLQNYKKRFGDISLIPSIILHLISKCQNRNFVTKKKKNLLTYVMSTFKEGIKCFASLMILNMYQCKINPC